MTPFLYEPQIAGLKSNNCKEKTTKQKTTAQIMGKCSQTNGLLSFYWISTTAMRGSAVRTTQV